MKKVFLITASLLLGNYTIKAQITSDPVKWDYRVVKDPMHNTIKIILWADINDGWHIYSKTQIKEKGGSPTNVVFSKNPLLLPLGATKEVGRVVEEKVAGLDIKYYEGKVTFEQTYKLKKNVPTDIDTAVEYMACTDTKCLPSKTKFLTIKVK